MRKEIATDQEMCRRFILELTEFGLDRGCREDELLEKDLGDRRRGVYVGYVQSGLGENHAAWPCHIYD